MGRLTFRRRAFRLLVVGVCLVGSTAAHGQDAVFTDKHCVACHNDRAKTGGLSLQGLSAADAPSHADIWEKVLRKLRSGEMPPLAVRVRPEPAEVKAFADTLESTLDRAAATNPDPGRPTVHRLNRAEYSNAVRDLLAVDVKPGSWLPVDDSGYGFDNIAAVLSMSPTLIERYMSAGRRIARLAVGDMGTQAVDETIEAVRDPLKGSRNEQLSDELPFDSRSGIAARHYFPLDAEYVFKLHFVGTDFSGVRRTIEVRLPVTAGLHTVGVTAPRENAKAEREAPGGGGGGDSRGLPYPIDLRLDGARVKRFDVTGPAAPDVSRLIVAGPYKATGPGRTPSRARIFVCRPASRAEESGCARTILRRLARRAFRRPVAAADVEALFALYRQGRAEGDFEGGIRKALEGLLVAPEFLFRIERDPVRTASGAASRPGRASRVSDLELASWLSFFLWSSIPDEGLLDLAERGRLHDADVLLQQVRRMLDDPRSDALVANFVGQWLQLRNVETVQPDPVIFPFDEALRASFIRETELLVTSIVRDDRSLLDLLTADYTFVNERLAEHYGISGVYGSQFRRVALTDPNRRGLLGQGSVLTVTSYPNRTSVVQRGKWILENLLGTPPPPPPPDVPALKAERIGKVSLREQMAAHRSNPVCASCHLRMDPIGFALENYDGVGKWRTRDGGQPIDASGTLPDGTAFQGPEGLTHLLRTRYRDDFVRTAIEKLLTYALGRGLEAPDAPTVRAIAREAGREDYRLSSLILAVVNSTPFQMRRVSTP